MINFKKCPECEQPWEYKQKEDLFLLRQDGSCKCGLIYRPTEWVFKIFSNGLIRWNRDGRCEIEAFIINESKYGFTILYELPIDYIQYNITQEQFNLYQTFS